MADYLPTVEAMLHDKSNVVTAELNEFMAAYAEDDNVWWRIDCGHHQNLFAAAIEELEQLRAEALPKLPVR